MEIIMDLEHKNKMLEAGYNQRINEVTEYQVNIDNYAMALDIIGDDPDLQAFKEQLQELLRTTTIEQKKSKIMLEVVKRQLGK